MPTEKRERYVLIYGEAPTRSSPTFTWSLALNRVGMATRYVSESQIVDTRCWLGLLYRAEALVLQWYGAVPPFLIRQLAWAPLMWVPLIRKWSGSDALNCLKDPAVRASAIRLDRIVSANIAASENLVLELETIDIVATLNPHVLSDTNSYIAKDKTFRKEAVLVYLPGTSKDFYGYPTVRAMVERFPNLTFIIVGDGTHSLASWPNVRSLDWIDDMDPVWAQVGMLLRITQHDGMPRMILEALARSKYVIHNRPMPGCWLAQSEAEVAAGLERYAHIDTPNVEGEKLVSAMVKPENERALAVTIRETKGKLSTCARAIAALAAYKLLQRRNAATDSNIEIG